MKLKKCIENVGPMGTKLLDESITALVANDSVRTILVLRKPAVQWFGGI